MKLCKDCRWKDDLTCNHPNNFRIDLVSGMPVKKYNYCNNLRHGSYLLDGTCGRRGRWFERKEAK